MCYTEILIKENKLKKEEEIDAIIIVLCFLTVSISTRIQKKKKKKRSCSYVISKRFFLGASWEAIAFLTSTSNMIEYVSFKDQFGLRGSKVELAKNCTKFLPTLLYSLSFPLNPNYPLI